MIDEPSLCQIILEINHAAKQYFSGSLPSLAGSWLIPVFFKLARNTINFAKTICLVTCHMNATQDYLCVLYLQLPHTDRRHSGRKLSRAWPKSEKHRINTYVPARQGIYINTMVSFMFAIAIGKLIGKRQFIELNTSNDKFPETASTKWLTF